MVPLEEEQRGDLARPLARTGAGSCSSGERAERLRHAVLDLPEPLRVVVTARYWGELPVPEIARMEGISEEGCASA